METRLMRLALWTGMGRSNLLLSIFFFGLAVSSMPASSTKAHEDNKKPDEILTTCFERSSGAGEASACVQRNIQSCYDQGSHTDIERAECTNRFLDGIMRLTAGLSLRMDDVSQETKTYEHEANASLKSYQEHVCRWPVVIFRGGTDAADYRANCIVSSSAATAFEMQQFVDFLAERGK